MDSLLFQLVVLVVLILFSSFFSGSEAALFSLTRSQVNRLGQQSGAGREIAHLLAEPRSLLVTILTGNLLVNVFATSAATSVSVGLFGEKGVGLAFVVMSVLIMVFGETLPKVIAVNRPQRFSRVSVYPLKVFHVVFFLARVPIAALTDRVIRALTAKLGAARSHFSSEEFVTALGIGRDDGHFGAFESELLANIMEFRDTIVKEIMTPSIKVFSLSVDLPPDEIEELVLQSGFSRVPVYGETADDIKGVLHVKDIAAKFEFGRELDVKKIMRVPYYVPESTKISDLFNELGSYRTHMAVVIDEYGSYVGIVTMEDILEELVGEIRDSKEPETSEFSLLDDGRIVVLGTMEIDEFNRVFETNIEDDENETIAGYVIGATGQIPHEGETIELGSLRFHIISAQPNRIRKMRVERT